jgi:hypothetical protein
VDLESAGPAEYPRESSEKGVAFQVVDRTTRHVMQRWIHRFVGTSRSDRHRRWVGAAPTTLPITPQPGGPGARGPLMAPQAPHRPLVVYRARRG